VGWLVGPDTLTHVLGSWGEYWCFEATHVCLCGKGACVVCVAHSADQVLCAWLPGLGCDQAGGILLQ
jgi:hypothetical protein